MTAEEAFIRARLRVEREAKRRGINPRTVWAAVDDELAHLGAAVTDTQRVQRAWRVLGQDWEEKGGMR